MELKDGERRELIMCVLRRASAVGSNREGGRMEGMEEPERK